MSGAIYWSLGEAMRGFAKPEPLVRSAELKSGDMLGGSYRIVELLGQGAFGRVYRAKDTSMGREVAVKLLTVSGGAREQRFVREGQIAASLDHPAIGKVFSTGEHGIHPYLVYELLEGARDLSQAALAWSREQRVRGLLSVAEGVAYAHERGVVHRDLKPENVIVDADGRCRVIDFGLAKEDSSERLTKTGALVGTPNYMAPECLFGQPVTSAADVWSLGVMLYWLLTTRLPFQAASLIELGGQIDKQPPDPPEVHDPTVPLALSAVCMRALARDPEARYRDGEALAGALRAVLNRKPEERIESAPNWFVLPLAAALAVAGVVGALVVSTTRGHVEPASQAGRPLTVESALAAGDAPRAKRLLAALRVGPRRALLVAQLAALEGRDPRPELRTALTHWPQAELGRALAIAELERGHATAAWRELGGKRATRWPRDAEAQALLQLVEQLRSRTFAPTAVEPLRAAAPEALNAWLEVSCRRDFGLWLWRQDPRVAERAGEVKGPLSDLVTRLESLQNWSLGWQQEAWARSCLACLRSDPNLAGDASTDEPLSRRVAAELALANGDPELAASLLNQPLPPPQRACGFRLKGDALLRLGRTEEARGALLESDAESPWDPRTCALLSQALPQGSEERARYAGLVQRFAARSAAESEEGLSLVSSTAPAWVQIPKLETLIARDPLSWGARYRRAMVRGTEFNAEALYAVLEAIRWDPRLSRDLHERVRTSVRTERGVGVDMDSEHAIGATGYVETVLGELRERPIGSWRDREALAVMQAFAVEMNLQNKWRKSAMRLCDEVLAEHPESAVTRLARAFLLIRSGRLDEADAELNVLEAWVPEAPLTAFYRALWLGRKQAAPEAIEAALAKARVQGVRGLGRHGLRLRFHEYEELVAYEGRVELRLNTPRDE